MALRKTADDQWTSNGVTSTFTIDMPDDPSSSASSAMTTCGWGWSLACSFGPESTTESPIFLDTNSTPIPWRRVTIVFDPSYISQASYGRITFEVAAQHLVRLENEIFVNEMNLPDGYRTDLAVYLRRSDESMPATIQVGVHFPENIGLTLPNPRDSLVDRALAGTLRGESMTDVKFYAYSRAGDGYVARPRSLFAKLALLEGRSDALDTYLSGFARETGIGFRESELVDLDDESVCEERFANYDFMSDSDLDDEEDNEDIWHPPAAEAETSTTLANVVSDPAPPVPALAPSGARRMGRVIMVKGYAFQTWNAFLYYLYTHQVSFRSLGTKPASESGEIPKCSAKSMYKLAEQFGLEDLKSLALNSLRSQLSTENIVREAFSTLTSLFPEIQDIEVDFLVPKIPELKGPLEAMLKSVCDGDKPKAHDILCKIVQKRGTV